MFVSMFTMSESHKKLAIRCGFSLTWCRVETLIGRVHVSARNRDSWHLHGTARRTVPSIEGIETEAPGRAPV